MRGYAWVCVGTHGYAWVCVGMRGCMRGYAWVQYFFVFFDLRKTGNLLNLIRISSEV